jgi:arylsulfatase A-like enzyme
MGNVFAHGGYDTAYIGKWHLAAGARAGTLDRDKPGNAPKESEFVPPGPARMGYQYWAAYNFHSNFNKAFYYRDTSERLFMPRFETDSETDLAIDYMKSRSSSGKPFFLTVAPHPPHPPWRPDQTPPGSLPKTPQDLYWRPGCLPFVSGSMLT